MSTLKVDQVQANTATELTLNDDVTVAEDLTVTGQIKAADGSVSAPSLSFANSTGSGLRHSGSNAVRAVSNGTDVFLFSSGQFNFNSGVEFGWGSGALGTFDTKLARDGANALAQRNSTTGQHWRVYNSYTDASNYERGNFSWTSNVLEITTAAAGTGNNRNIRIRPVGGTLILGSNNSDRWNINSSGHFLADTDNTTDIGAAGATRPRTLYVGTSVITPVVRDATTTELTHQDSLGNNIGWVPHGYISGLVQSRAADTDHDTTISAGLARDATDAKSMRLASAITKQIDANWAVGTNQGGLDTGAVGNNTWYYIWLILRSDTGVVDALYSTSATSPTMPTNYDFKRLIGAVKTDGSANILAYTAYELSGGGLEILWTDPPLDINVTNGLTTTARTDTLSVPTAFSVKVSVNVQIDDAGSPAILYISCPDVNDEAVSTTVGPLASTRVAAAGNNGMQQLDSRTSSTGTLRSVGNTTVDSYRLVTTGFEWARRN